MKIYPQAWFSCSMVRNYSVANQISLTTKPIKQAHGQKEREEYYA